MMRECLPVGSGPRRRAAALLAVVFAASGRVDPSLVAAEPRPDAAPRAEELVRRLGSLSYRGREGAAAALRERGLEARSALFDGMRSGDAEIALSCRWLWGQVRIDAGWQIVRETLGDSPATRELYDRMFQALPDAWYELAESSRDPEASFAGPREAFEASRLQLLAMRPEQTVDDWVGSLANLLFFAVRAAEEDPDQTLPGFEGLLDRGRSQQALADNEALRRLAARLPVASPFRRLLVELRGRSSLAAKIAREMLRDEETPARERQYALLALATSDREEDQALIDGRLDDATTLDVLLVKGAVVTSQLRDVALAVGILRAGRDPADFGFNHLRPDDVTIYEPASLGFRDPAEREAAFAKWSARGSR
jgi:hypothetical protein